MVENFLFSHFLLENADIVRRDLVWVTLRNQRVKETGTPCQPWDYNIFQQLKITLNLFSILTGQRYCQYTRDCAEPSNCLPPIANLTFPTVWEYLQLGADLSKGIFEQSDNAVALRSLKTHGVNGSLEFYSNSQWTAVRALTPSNALVLGKTSYLR